MKIPAIVVPSGHWTRLTDFLVHDVFDLGNKELNQLLAQVVQLPSITRLTLTNSVADDRSTCLDADTLYHLVTFVSNVRVRKPANAHLKLSTCAAMFSARPSWWIYVSVRLYGPLLAQLLDNSLGLQVLSIQNCRIASEQVVIDRVPRLRAQGVEVNISE